MVKLVIENLSVIYRSNDHRLLAIDRLSLDLSPGKITALVGESGSGKTTLGKTVMGLLPKSAEFTGTVMLDDLEITGAAETTLNTVRWSRIAMLFQNGAANLNPVHRVIDQLAEPLIQHKAALPSEAAAQAGKMMARMGLDSILGRRYPHELSGGEIQRVLMAMALIMDPEILLLDEPTAALDPMTMAAVNRIILEARHDGKSILLITHDLDLARNTADEVAVLYLGQVMEILPSKSLFQAPRHPYTLALCRSFPAMGIHRDLGGIRGDGFFRVLHNHPKNNGAAGQHAHVIGVSQWHKNGHPSPTGCLFHPRCTQTIPECGEKEVFLEPNGNHQVRCLRGGIVTALQLEAVAKRYGDTPALAPTHVSVNAGETLCLVGETGSGKTTLAMIAAGFLKPDQGRRFFQGRDVDQWIKKEYPSLAGKIGVVHQHPAQAVSHRFTVFDIVKEPLIIRRQSRNGKDLQNRVAVALMDVHLPASPDFMARYPDELNMGALQRVCIARALISQPAMLVADEPTSALDPSVQAKVLKLLIELQIEKGLTMLFVTHDIGLARKIADKIGVMLSGNIVEIGPAAEVFNYPLHPYTRSLIQYAGGYSDELEPPTEMRYAQGCPFSVRCGYAVSSCFSAVPPMLSPDSGNRRAMCFQPLNTNSNYNPRRSEDGVPSKENFGTNNR
jgi:peptide/nickel transport system ATP-binding protein